MSGTERKEENVRFLLDVSGKSLAYFVLQLPSRIKSKWLGTCIPHLLCTRSSGSPKGGTAPPSGAGSEGEGADL